MTSGTARTRSASRIADDVSVLAAPPYSRPGRAVQRWAYNAEYGQTIGYFSEALEALGFTVAFDPVGTLVARNRPVGAPVFGMGSHCDANRNGGRWDGTLGVVTALEVARLAAERDIDLPLQIVSFLEEEGSGFDQTCLGSRIIAGRVSETDLRSRFRAIDDGRPFWDHAKDAGFEPERWLDAPRVLDDLVGWIEVHIEQGRVLQDTGHNLGVVDRIAGWVHADVTIDGRADHAGATPMDFRRDPTLALAEAILTLERLARAAGHSTVGTVGEIEVTPGLINVIPSRVRFSLDIRGVSDAAFLGVYGDVVDAVSATAASRKLGIDVGERHRTGATELDAELVTALEKAGRRAGGSVLTMPSGALHDTAYIADRVPSAMLFVPCRDGVSHSPDEHADASHAALAAEVALDVASTAMNGHDR